MASTAVSTDPNAVITTIGSAAFCRLADCKNSSPLTPGNLRSVRTRSTVSEASSFNPVSASPAESALNPSSPRFNSSNRRILASSSMMRIVGMLGRVGSSASVGTGDLARGPQRARFWRAGGVDRPSRAHLGSRLRLNRFYQWKENRQHPPSLRCILDADRPLMPINNLRHDRKPQSNAGFLRRHKRIEDLLTKRVRHTRPSIGQHKLYSVAIILRRQPNLDPQRASVIFHRFIGILHQIEKRLLAQAFVERNQRKVGGIMTFDLHWLPFPAHRNNIEDAIENRRQVSRLPLRV